MNFDDVSQESRQFLNELRLYLFVNEHNEKETEEIVETLYVRLKEAEENGESVEHVIGKSPREYMESLSEEIGPDIRSWGKYIVVIIIGFFSMVLLQDALKGVMAYSLIEIIGNIAVLVISIGAILTLFKYMAERDLPKKKEWKLFGFVGFLPLLLFVVLIIVNRLVESPIYIASQSIIWVIGLAALVCLIAISVWSKSFILAGAVALFTVPDYILSNTNLDAETQMFVSTAVTFGGILMIVYLIAKLRER